VAVTTAFRAAALVVVVAKVVVVVVEVVVVGAVVVVVEEATVFVEVPLVDDEHAASNRAALDTAAAAKIFRFITPPHPRPGRTLANRTRSYCLAMGAGHRAGCGARPSPRRSAGGAGVALLVLVGLAGAACDSGSAAKQPDAS
jgi:hypothetical protein